MGICWQLYQAKQEIEMLQDQLVSTRQETADERKRAEVLMNMMSRKSSSSKKKGDTSPISSSSQGRKQAVSCSLLPLTESGAN